jgi:hypothetical protein
MNQIKLKPWSKRLLYWSPRVIGILLVLFVAMFSLDVFEGNHGFWKTVVAFVMHQVPTMFALVPLLLAWRWEWIGAVTYLCVAVFSIIFGIGTWDLIAFFCFSGPLVIAGILFLLNWTHREQLKPGTI